MNNGLHVLREDPIFVGCFFVALTSAILTWLSIYYISSRIFNDNKSAGVAMPVFSSVCSVTLGMMIAAASIRRRPDDLRMLGGWPNLAALCSHIVAQSVLDVWTSRHRVDLGFITGILSDTQTVCRVWRALPALEGLC